MSTQILIIEDEEQIRENVAEWLRLNGFEVETAPDGKQGVTQAILERPDLILCDVLMPHMDGYQVLETIRSNRSLTTVPFMFLTAKTDLKDVRRGMSLGADDYLTKPFTGESLLLAVENRLQREALRKASLQAQLAEQHLKMAQTAGHEYNTTLNGIIGMSTLLANHLDEFDDEDTVSMLETIRVCGLRLKRSLDNVHRMGVLLHLDPSQKSYAFFTSGTTTLRPERVKEQIRLVENRQEQQVSWRVDVEEATLQISEENLTLIVDELIDNAIKFSDQTGIVVTGYLEGEEYRLTVGNKGRTFKPEHVAQIAPYTQFDRQEFEQQGFGLGLAIVKKLVELNHGSLSIGCYPDGWTKAMVWLPGQSVN
ncbi:hybrid sensor histidine kinase/response regulator [Larkinella punicea]|jgi:two-component system sensor histidine kinase/response regulator|uniref:Response regulator n=1 Tax=Larkinella punicea TaxID=2315727 RepID=A0A368JKX8_9BACT|nr:response regulator [Larkinella punicea]RCR66781.1 response regulator [Larkinella punicea]